MPDAALRNAVVVEDGPILETFATGVLPVHSELHHSIVTVVFDHPLDGPHGHERHVKTRVIFSPEGLLELARAVLEALPPERVYALLMEAGRPRELPH